LTKNTTKTNFLLTFRSLSETFISHIYLLSVEFQPMKLFTKTHKSRLERNLMCYLYNIVQKYIKGHPNT